jgi:septal ring factor EnvC (AmiA/AmiB activator)
MTKIFTSLLASLGGLFLVVAALLFLNRADTNDSIADAQRAQIQLEQIDFDVAFAKSSGQELSPQQLKRYDEKRARLEATVDQAEAQRTAARTKRQEVSRSLDEAITEWARAGGNERGPGPTSVAMAGLILFLFSVALRAITRKPPAEGEKSGRLAASLDRIIDLAKGGLAKIGAAK